MDRAYLSRNINEVIKVSSDIWRKGWAESNGGNITVRMTVGSVEEFDHEYPRTGWIPLGASYPNLANEFFVVSGSGRFLRNIELLPEKNIGVIKIDPKGENYQVIWGFEGNTKPTSELKAHLGIHSVRKNISDEYRAVIHTHAPNIIALSYIEALDSKKISQIIWEMHTECAVVFPEGIGLLEWLMPGTSEIAEGTAELFKRFRIIVWEQHGVLACGRNLDYAFGLIDTAEKVAGIYLKALSSNKPIRKLSKERIISIAENFNAPIDKSLL